MSIFTYTARRELAPGTSLLAVVSRDFRLRSKRKTRKPFARQNTSLSGSVESLLLRSEVHYTCQTALLEPRALIEAHVVEFLSSVENAELFTFDRHGTPSVPDNPVSCILVSKTFTEVEKSKKFHQYGFVIRES